MQKIYIFVLTSFVYDIFLLYGFLNLSRLTMRHLVCNLMILLFTAFCYATNYIIIFDCNIRLLDIGLQLAKSEGK